LQLRKMEAAREIAGLVANSNNKLMLDSESLLLDRTFRAFVEDP
jgi:prohibitin 2